MRNLFSLIVLLSLVVPTIAWAGDPLKEDMEGFEIDVNSMLLAKQYNKLDALADELRKTNPYFPGAESKIQAFYRALGSFGEGPGMIPFREKDPLLQMWVNGTPKSTAAKIAYAELWINLAEQMRGGGFANSVSKSENKEFEDDMTKAQKALMGIDPKTDPFVYQEYMDMARYGGGRGQNFQIYAAAIRDFPRYFPFYVDHANMLQAKWYGSPTELSGYMQSLFTSPGGEDGQVIYALAGEFIVQQYTGEPAPNHTEVNWPWLKKSFETLEKKYGLSRADLYRLLKFGQLYSDGEFAAKFLPGLIKSAQGGNSSDQYYVGMAYLNGIGVAKNQNEAMKWLALAAAQDTWKAQIEIANLYYAHNDYATALKWYLHAAVEGSYNAQIAAGMVYEKGGNGVTQDYAAAMKFYKEAEIFGSPDAMYHLGLLYYQGLGVPRNMLKAYEYMFEAEGYRFLPARQWLTQNPPTKDTFKDADLATPGGELREAKELLLNERLSNQSGARAKSLIDDVLQKNPQDPDGLTMLGLYNVETAPYNLQEANHGDMHYTYKARDGQAMQKTEEMLDRVLIAHPEEVYAYLVLAQIEVDHDYGTGQARDCLEAADLLGVKPEDAAQLNLLWAQVLDVAGEAKNASQHAADVLKQTDNHGMRRGAYALLIKNYVKQKQYDVANTTYQQWIAEDAGSSDAQAGYSNFLRLYMKDYDGAVSAAKHAVNINNNSSELTALAMALYDKCADMEMNHKGSKEDVQKAHDAAYAIEPRPERLMPKMGSYAEEATFMKWMKSKSVSVDASDTFGVSALMLAAENGRVDALKSLIAMGADPNHKSRDTGDTALASAVESNHVEAVKFLLASGATQRETQGTTLLALAQTLGYGDVMDVLQGWYDSHPQKAAK